MIKDEYSSYSEYRLKSNRIDNEEKKIQKPEANIIEPKQKKLSFEEKKELKSLEKQIKKLEIEKKTIEDFFKDPKLSYEVMIEKSNELEKLNFSLDKKLLRWMELEEQNS